MKTILITLATTMIALTQVAQANVESREVAIGISDAYIPSGFDSSSDAFVVVNGIFPNGCYRWKRAEIQHQDNLHIVQSFADVSQGMCLMVLVPFNEEIQLGRLASGNHTIRFISGDGTYLEKSVTVE